MVDELSAAPNKQRLVPPLMDQSQVLRARSLRIASGVGKFVALASVLSAFAWWSGNVELAALLPGTVPVDPLYALCLMLFGVSVVFAAQGGEDGSNRWHKYSRLIAGIAGGIALVHLVTIPFGSLSGTLAGGEPPKYPKTATLLADCLILLSLSLVGMRLSSLMRRASQVTTVLSAIVSFFLVLGLTNGVNEAGTISAFAGTSLSGAIAIAAIAVAIIHASPSQGIGKIICSSSYGGSMARMLLPIVVLIPLVFRLIRLINESWHFLSTEVLAVVLSATFIFVMSAVVLLNARRLNHLDQFRREAASRNASLASIVESSPDAILSKDLDGTILSWNAGAARMYGYSEAEAVGANIRMLSATADTSEIDSIMSRIGEGEGIFNHEAVRRKKDGSLIEVNLTITPIRNERGIVLSASVVARDLTKLKEYEARFRNVVESAPIAMIMVDEDGRIKLVNALTQSLFGYERAEIVGARVETLLPERFVAGHAKLRHGYSSGPEARQMGVGRDLYARRKDGSEFAVEIGLNPITTSEGVLTLAAIADITERKLASEALEAHAVELKRSNAELEQFAYVASHDLQEPLRMVVSYMDLLQARYKGAIDERADKYIFYAVDGARRMQRLVQDLLTVSRVSSQAKPLVPTSAEAVLVWVLRGLGQAIAESGATVTHDPLPEVMADEGQLGQVFQNLISNGIKFRSDAPPQIHVSAEGAGEKWRFSVTDNGIGIEPQYHEKIFQMFQRLHERDKYEGSGIGLPVSRKIVERHGGELSVSSDLGRGSTFSFTIPKSEANLT